MANQVVGTGSVEIIFDYEKNLKNMLSSIKKRKRYEHAIVDKS